MDNVMQITEQVKQLSQNQSSSSVQQVIQDIEALNNAQNQSPEKKREQIAQTEAAIQNLIDNLEGENSEALVSALNQLQVELMNMSQDIEHQQLNQTATREIPGKPLNMDKDPEPPTLM